MVLISNGSINIKNHHKIKQNEKKHESKTFNYSEHLNKIITNKYHGLLEDKYIYEGSDDESESDAEKETVTKTKKK